MKRIVVLVAGLVLAACGSGSSSVGLSVRAGSQALTVSDAGVDLGSGLTVSRVRVVIRELELEREHESEAEHRGRGRGSDDAFHAGPLLVDLSASALTGRVQEVLALPVAAGVYGKLKLKIGRPDDSAALGSEFAPLVAERASVIVDGTMNGEPFHFATPLELEFEREGRLEVGPEANITLSFDPAAWFAAAGGARLDPRRAADLLAIGGNLRASFDCFGDSNHDGLDDHGGRGRGSDDPPGDDRGGRDD
jgi:hypothetical protein